MAENTKIIISKELMLPAPDVALGCIESTVVFNRKNEDLWNEIEQKVETLHSELKIEEIGLIHGIASSKKAYRACGKDPARYRLSAEALLRRVVKRGEIYQVNNLVDLLNLVSISTGFSIGGYDAEKINGTVILGIGLEGEPYEGIGRGELNIAMMPVFRDSEGAFGTFTSDSVRTSVTYATKRFLMVIADFGSGTGLDEAIDFSVELLVKYAKATDLETKTIKLC
jgi:DNA/RNA-binding domain of Phe-tRNA-synthetase-like protein